MGPVGALLLQAAGGADAARSAGGGAVEVIAIIAIAIIGLALIALLAVLIPAVLELRKAAGKMEVILDRISGDLDPVITRAKSIADNADYITGVVRADVGEVSGTIRRAKDGLNVALDTTEKRVKELGALLRLFQDEVEQTFVSGTSMLRGFRAGADALRQDALGLLDEMDNVEDDFEEDFGVDPEELEDVAGEYIDESGDLRAAGTILDSDEVDEELDAEIDDLDDDFEDEFDDDIEDTLEDAEGMDDGYDWARDGGDGDGDAAAKPRIRRRPAP
jgi:hypothetical protein